MGPIGDCVVVEDFGIYLSPKTAQALMERMQERLSADDEAPWANLFAVEENGRLTDAHRVVFTAVRGDPSPATELVYECPDSDVCVNPQHVTEVPLPADRSWEPAIIRYAAIRGDQVELGIDLAEGKSGRLFVRPDIVDTLRLADVSALPERIVMVSERNSDGWTDVLLGEQRLTFGQRSLRTGWLHPDKIPGASDDCPCASGKSYEDCHGAT